MYLQYHEIIASYFMLYTVLLDSVLCEQCIVIVKHGQYMLAKILHSAITMDGTLARIIQPDEEFDTW